METMTSKQWLDILESPEMDRIFTRLYSDTGESRARLKRLLTLHEAKCPGKGVRIFSAPGRTEICGNHTDHNNGKVIAASVDLDILAVVSPRKDKKIQIHTDELFMDIEKLEIIEEEKNSSQALIRGIAYELFGKRNLPYSGFDCTLHSNVPMGSGLSSSAAFEIVTGRILSSLYLDNRTTRIELARTGQKAENQYFGKPSGLMDQMASSWGNGVIIDFEKPGDPLIQEIPLNFSDAGYQLMIIKTGGDHKDLTGLYGEIAHGMKYIARFFNQEVLRPVDREEFYRSLPGLLKEADHLHIMKAMHYFNENERVRTLFKAIKTGNHQKVLEILNKSGESSYEILQNVLIPGRARQELALSIILAREILAGKGAVRVHGGGFAGTILCLIPGDEVTPFKEKMEHYLGRDTVLPLKIRKYGSVEFTPRGQLEEAPLA